MADNLETLGGDAVDAVGPDAAPAELTTQDHNDEDLEDEEGFEDYDAWRAHETARARPARVKLRGLRLQLKPQLSIRAELTIREAFSSSDGTALNRILAEMVVLVGDEASGTDPLEALVAADLSKLERDALFSWAFSHLRTDKPMTFVEAVTFVEKAEAIARESGPTASGKAARRTRGRASAAHGQPSSETSGASTA